MACVSGHDLYSTPPPWPLTLPRAMDSVLTGPSFPIFHNFKKYSILENSSETRLGLHDHSLAPFSFTHMWGKGGGAPGISVNLGLSY